MPPQPVRIRLSWDCGDAIFQECQTANTISGIRYAFTPAVARERNYNPVHFVVIVELVVV